MEPTDQNVELPGNEMARFKTTILFGPKEVGYAVGRNKKQSKLNACKHILQAMVPLLYQDWLASHQPGTMPVPINAHGGGASMEPTPRPQSPGLDNMMNVEENPELAQQQELQSEQDTLQSQFNALSLDQLIQMTTGENKSQEELALEYSEH